MAVDLSVACVTALPVYVHHSTASVAVCQTQATQGGSRMTGSLAHFARPLLHMQLGCCMSQSGHLLTVLQVVCDGEPLELPDDIEGVLILNINSYMGGVDLWASGFNSTVSMKTGKQSLCDGMLEVS